MKNLFEGIQVEMNENVEVFGGLFEKKKKASVSFGDVQNMLMINAKPLEKLFTKKRDTHLQMNV